MPKPFPPSLLLLPAASFVLFLLCSSSANAGGAVVSLDAGEVAALRAIKDSLIDLPSSAPFLSTWDFERENAAPCSFSGVVCSPSGHVTILSLGTGLSNSPGLSGSLPPAISGLSGLTQLILFPGLVTGPIPSELGQLTELRVISLTHNRLNGYFPSSLSFLPNLHTLDLSFNSLSGTVPPLLFSLPSLKVLVLSSNSLSGQLPTEMSSQSQLLHLDLMDNRFTGELPSSLPATLRYLSVAKNMMWGPLTALESLPGGNGHEEEDDQLEFLDMSMNQFNGLIPPSLFRHRRLSSLYLQRNRLSGVLPQTTLSEALQVVDLSHNSLLGDLPPSLAGVETLLLNNNKFTGMVPAEFLDSLVTGAANTLYLQNNYFTRFPSLKEGQSLPETAAICVSNNCMLLPPRRLWSASCPDTGGATMKLLRPRSQCMLIH